MMLKNAWDFLKNFDLFQDTVKNRETATTYGVIVSFFVIPVALLSIFSYQVYTGNNVPSSNTTSYFPLTSFKDRIKIPFQCLDEKGCGIVFRCPDQQVVMKVPFEEEALVDFCPYGDGSVAQMYIFATKLYEDSNGRYLKAPTKYKINGDHFSKSSDMPGVFPTFSLIVERELKGFKILKNSVNLKLIPSKSTTFLEIDCSMKNKNQRLISSVGCPCEGNVILAAMNLPSSCSYIRLVSNVSFAPYSINLQSGYVETTRTFKSTESLIIESFGFTGGLFEIVLFLFIFLKIPYMKYFGKYEISQKIGSSNKRNENEIIKSREIDF